MNVSDRQRKVIEDASRAMQIGSAAEAEILSLFTEDAVWVEPYTGQRRAHVGKSAIQAALRQMWLQPAPPKFSIVTDRMDAEGACVRVEWTCSAERMPLLMQGYSLYTISTDSRISRLELFILPPAAMK